MGIFLGVVVGLRPCAEFSGNNMRGLDANHEWRLSTCVSCGILTHRFSSSVVWMILDMVAIEGVGNGTNGQLMQCPVVATAMVGPVSV